MLIAYSIYPKLKKYDIKNIDVRDYYIDAEKADNNKELLIRKSKIKNLNQDYCYFDDDTGLLNIIELGDGDFIGLNKDSEIFAVMHQRIDNIQISQTAENLTILSSGDKERIAILIDDEQIFNSVF